MRPNSVGGMEESETRAYSIQPNPKDPLYFKVLNMWWSASPYGKEGTSTQ